MIKIYLAWIKSDKMSAEDVPPKWRGEVEKALNTLSGK